MREKLALLVNGKSYNLSDSILEVGREENRIVCIPDLSVSGFHATIGCRQNVYMVRDEHSSNGTLLNGIELEAGNSYCIKRGDDVSFGEVKAQIVTVIPSQEMSIKELVKYAQWLNLGAQYLLKKPIEVSNSCLSILGANIETNAPIVLKGLCQGLGEANDAVDVFNRECRLVRKLKNVRHPNIRNILHVEAQGENAYYIMEADGKTLQAYIDQKSITKQIAIDIILQVLEALSFLHKEHQILHRNLQPCNIIIDTEGVPKIGNFSSIKGESSVSLTIVPSNENRNIYMAPEVLFDGEHSLQSEIYSIAAIFYHMVKKVPLFATVKEACDFATHGTELPLAFGGEPKLNEILSKALSVIVEERYNSHEEFIDDLKSLQPKSSSEKLESGRATKTIRMKSVKKASKALEATIDMQDAQNLFTEIKQEIDKVDIQHVQNLVLEIKQEFDKLDKAINNINKKMEDLEKKIFPQEDTSEYPEIVSEDSQYTKTKRRITEQGPITSKFLKQTKDRT